ncbi:hypothetical protein [Sulfitobacter sp. TBRI5]|uniref:hypothetical protein n=1 Tax=Sulfitobacter sp. TBRI5 TaxID=2989732 RepID=UPI003D9AB9C2
MFRQKASQHGKQFARIGKICKLFFDATKPLVLARGGVGFWTGNGALTANLQYLNNPGFNEEDPRVLGLRLRFNV